MEQKYHIRNLYWLLISFFIIIVDQISKFLAVKYLDDQEPFALFPSLNLWLRHNRGSAFSFLDNGSKWPQFLFGFIAIMVTVILIFALLRLNKKEKWFALAFSFIIGGALGNLWDRLTLGYVVDFIDFYVKSWHFATFNLADSAITLGALLLALLWSKEK